MVVSGILKLKIGPFWFKTSILLVNVVPFGTRNAMYVLRVERPRICGGPVELPIGRRGFPADLPPRSAKDRRKLQFSIRYGAKGKKLRFLAPTAGVYDHWIAALREAFEGNAKVTKRSRNETASTIDESNACVSGSDNCSEAVGHNTNDGDSMYGQRGSEQLDASAITPDSCDQRGNVVADANARSNNHDSVKETPTRDAANMAIDTANSETPASRGMHERSDVDSDDDNSPGNSNGLTLPLTPASAPAPTPPVDEKVETGQQNLFCIAIDPFGTTGFSVYVPPQQSLTGHRTQSEKLFKLPFVQWARWIARDIRGGECVPEVFRVTSSSCKRVQLSEILRIAQPFFA